MIMFSKEKNWQLTVALVFSLAIYSPSSVVVAETLGEMSNEGLLNTVAGQKHPKQVSSLSAQEAANAWLDENGLRKGWDRERERYIAVGGGYFLTKNPRASANFIDLRGSFAEVAKLEGKARIIEYFETEMSASSYAEIPGSPLRTQLDEKSRKVNEKINLARFDAVDLLQEQDKAEAEDLDNAEMAERIVSLLDAAIKKLDSTYSAKEIEQEKKDQLEKIKSEVASARQMQQELEAEAAKLKGSLILEQGTTVKTLSRHPLFGATTLASFESWDRASGEFQVVVVMMWSPKMEAQIRAMITGEDVRVKPGSVTLTEYLKDDWCSTVGSRRFRDEEGMVWFLGIGHKLSGKGAARTLAEREAANLAGLEVAMAVFSDVESTRELNKLMQQTDAGALDNNATVDVVSSVRENVKAYIQKRSLNGWGSVASGNCIHPISRKTIHYNIYGMNKDDAVEALRQKEGSYITAVLDGTHQQVLQGTKKGQEAEVAKARSDTTPAAVGEEAAKKRIQEGVEAELSKVAPQVAQESDGTASDADCTSDCPDQGQAQSGTFSGAGQSDTDW